MEQVERDRRLAELAATLAATAEKLRDRGYNGVVADLDRVIGLLIALIGA